MRAPRKGIARDGQRREPSPAPGRDREERDQHDQARPDIMQRPRRGLAVLAQVKGPEIGEARIGSRHGGRMRRRRGRSEEHTSELQSLMRISYAVLCLKKKKNTNTNNKVLHNYKTQQIKN